MPELAYHGWWDVASIVLPTRDRPHLRRAARVRSDRGRVIERHQPNWTFRDALYVAPGSFQCLES